MYIKINRSIPLSYYLHCQQIKFCQSNFDLIQDSVKSIDTEKKQSLVKPLLTAFYAEEIKLQHKALKIKE